MKDLLPYGSLISLHSFIPNNPHKFIQRVEQIKKYSLSEDGSRLYSYLEMEADEDGFAIKIGTSRKSYGPSAVKDLFNAFREFVPEYKIHEMIVLKEDDYQFDYSHVYFNNLGYAIRHKDRSVLSAVRTLFPRKVSVEMAWKSPNGWLEPKKVYTAHGVNQEDPHKEPYMLVSDERERDYTVPISVIKDSTIELFLGEPNEQ